ncbi:MAG: protein kinase [Chitinivibrionales bacterium]|nr:protein kinase [Chitinivibrionales bacterium]
MTFSLRDSFEPCYWRPGGIHSGAGLLLCIFMLTILPKQSPRCSVQKDMSERLKYNTPAIKLALEKKLITEDQHNQCKDLLRKSKKIGLTHDIEEIFIKQGFLQEEDLEELRELISLGEGGTQFGSYRLLYMLGEGGMGKVYRAVHEFMQRDVAIKVIHYKLSLDKSYTTRFFQEIRALAKLHHPNIITIYDAGRVKRKYYFAMELVEGTTLKVLADAGNGVAEKSAIDIVRATADALQEAHKHDIVHRDVKPENILLDEDNNPVLTDFGVVMHHDADHMTLTQSGNLVGSVHYASPEQVEGLRDIDGRSDIYSLGATLYYALTAKPAYNGATPPEILSQHLAGNFKSPRRYNSAISRKTVGLLRKMMARSREKRFQTMREVVEYIDRPDLAHFATMGVYFLVCGILLFLAGLLTEFKFQVLLSLFR